MAAGSRQQIRQGPEPDGIGFLRYCIGETSLSFADAKENRALKYIYNNF